eukprot:PhM_4_TR9421/c0_g1_i1/m.63313/K10596/UBE4A; ubiquitin conjugation factor E4 A
MEVFLRALSEAFGAQFFETLKEELTDVGLTFAKAEGGGEIPLLDVSLAEYALVVAIESTEHLHLDLSTQLVYVYNALPADETPLREVIARYFALNVVSMFNTAQQHPPQGALKIIGLLVPESRSNSTATFDDQSGTTLTNAPSDEFLRCVVDNLTQDEVEHAFGPVFKLLSSAINSPGMLSSRCLEPLLRLVGLHKHLAAAFLKMDNHHTVNASFVASTPFGASVSFGLDAATDHALPDEMALGSKEEAIRRLGDKTHFLLRSAVAYNHRVARALLAVDRTLFLTVADGILEANKEWKKDHGNITVASRVGMLASLCSVVIQLVEPLYGNDEKQMPRLDPSGFYHSKCPIHNEDKKTPSDADSCEEPHVVANIFFLSLKALTLCAAMLRKVETLMPSLDRQMGTITDPMHRAHVAQLQRTCLSVIAFFVEEEFASRLRRFTEYVTRWLLYSASKQLNSYAVPAEANETWHYVAQDVFEELGVVLGFLLRNPRTRLGPIEAAHFLKFVTVFATSTSHMTNKHHRGRYALVVRQLLSLEQVPLEDSMMETLISCVLQCYVDVEALGEYKTEPRHHLNCVLNQLWGRQDVCFRIKRRVAQMGDQFTKFTNMLIADGNRTLDSALESLKEIATLQNGGEVNTNENQGEEQDENGAQRRARTRPERIEELIQHVRGNMQLANEILRFVTSLCSVAPEAFLQGLITDQVACMLDYFFSQLAGPKMSEIRVGDEVLRRAEFNHRALVEMLVECYLGIAACGLKDVFIRSMVEDTRSYNPTTFRDIIRFLEAKSVHVDRLPSLVSFFNEVETAHAEQEEIEEALADPPEHLTCQITCGLLIDPIGLPGMSDVFVEARSMYRHLLSEEFNPFNRQPLTAPQLSEYNNTTEMLEVRNKIRQEVAEWKSHKLSEYREKKSK